MFLYATRILAAATVDAPTASKTARIIECPKCGKTLNGNRNCCASDGAWSGKCGVEADTVHTWRKGMIACKKKLAGKAQGATIIHDYDYYSYYSVSISAAYPSITDEPNTEAKVNTTNFDFGVSLMPTLIVLLLMVLIV